MGTALAVTIARGGGAVVLGMRRAALLEAMRAGGENAILPGIILPSTVELTDDWERAARDADTIVMAVPSRFARAANRSDRARDSPPPR